MIDVYQAGKDALTLVVGPLIAWSVKMSGRVSALEQSNKDLSNSVERIERGVERLTTHLLDQK